ncbi:MAG TPA: LysM peptidoglycan-binding domain-containing protein [Ktedonobacterales bacterium]
MRKRLLIFACCTVAACGAFLAIPVHSASASTACRATYTVKRGDTLSAIGARYGVSYKQIAQASGIANPNLIYPGQKLCIPAGSSGGTGGTGSTPKPPQSTSGAPPAGICAWCRPAGHPAFHVSDYRGDPYSRMYGWCTWWVVQKRLDERWGGLGAYAYQWFWNAPSHGFRTGTTPVAGATVVFQRGVDGASSWGGHVGHVEAVYSGGWFLISEMNFYWNGGGWARVSYRYVHVGSGVGFIY